MKLINWNCLEVMKEIEDNSVDLICTDPPYKVTKKWCAWNSWWMMITKETMNWNVFKYNDISCKEYATEFYRILKNDTHCYIMTNHINLIEMLNEFTKVWFRFTKCLIWNKSNKIMGRYYMSQYEYIMFFRKWWERKINNCWTADIIDIPNKKTKNTDWKNLHDTEKPVELMKVLIENSSNKWEIIFDPFMWIWTTWIACKNLNRDFIGIELDEKYYKIACNRINTL